VLRFLIDNLLADRKRGWSKRFPVAQNRGHLFFAYCWDYAWTLDEKFGHPGLARIIRKTGQLVRRLTIRDLPVCR